MIEFIKENSKIRELYIDTDTLNRIIGKFKKEIISKKETFFELANIDKKKCNQILKIESILDLLEEFKNETIVKRKEKQITLVSYYGSPYITINLCMQALIQKRIILAIVEDNMLCINKFLISIFNNILNEFKICKMIKLFNLVKIEEIKNLENIVDNIEHPAQQDHTAAADNNKKYKCNCGIQPDVDTLPYRHGRQYRNITCAEIFVIFLIGLHGGVVKCR